MSFLITHSKTDSSHFMGLEKLGLAQFSRIQSSEGRARPEVISAKPQASGHLAPEAEVREGEH